MKFIKDKIYLDNAFTTLYPEVIKVITNIMKKDYGNQFLMDFFLVQ